MLVVHVKVLRCFKHVRVVGEMASVSQKLPNIVDMILYFFFFFSELFGYIENPSENLSCWGW